MNMEQMLAEASKMDLNRQRQIEAQKQSINRLLEARELDDDTAWDNLIKDLTEQTKAKLDAHEKLNAIRETATDAVAQGNNSAYIDRIVEVLDA